MISDFLLNHLWQSTLFGAVAALLTLLFRKNHARVRYALWLAASIKFLIPFSLFIAIGNSIDFGRQQSASIAQPAITFVQDISQPFGAAIPLAAGPKSMPTDRSNLFQSFLFAAWLCGCLAVLVFYLAKGRSIKAAVRKAGPITQGRAFTTLQQLRQVGGWRLRIRLASSSSSMEPGVIGIFRPVLLLPEGMPDRLSDAELEAILAHEMSHIHRRDNLFSAVHMFIEALFWFHPMIWWLGAKLVQERERACDEEVLRLGKDPQAYAEGILKVCQFYLESPLACVAGVTGSDMKKRIHSIMTHHIGSKLGFTKKLLLASAGILALSFPLSIGLLTASFSRAQSQEAPKPTFEVLSIKEAENCGNVAPGVKLKIPGGTTYEPRGRFTTCSQLSYIIRDAYQMELSSSLSGVPDWSADILYRIEAKAEGDPDKEQMRLMVQSLLEERFKLKMHRESRVTPIYSLIVAKGSHKLQTAKDEQGNPIVSLPSPEELKKKGMDDMAVGGSRPLSEIISKMAPGSYSIWGGQERHFTGKALSMERFTIFLYGNVGRLKVIDKTGLAGLYDIQLNYAPSGLPGAEDPAASAEPSAPTIFNALQEQLGLKLESGKAPLDYYIIDRVEKPSEN